MNRAVAVFITHSTFSLWTLIRAQSELRGMEDIGLEEAEDRRAGDSYYEAIGPGKGSSQS